MTFVQARNYTRGRIRPLRLIVWHDMEAPEGPTTAEAVANYFANQPPSVNGSGSSAHTCCDENSHVECVNEGDTAWAAPGANADGYHVELAGYARQTAAEWTDASSKATIDQGAIVAAGVMKRNGIPAVWLTDAQVADGRTKGMTTHIQITRVLNHGIGHTDPGANFPYAYALAAVKARLGVAPSAPAPAPVVTKPTTKPSPTVSIPKFPGVLRRGSKGTAVRQLQAKLASRGWKITVDGVFGPGTEAVVKQFQANHKPLVVDGVVGINTFNRIYGP